jgi:uncharacterized protein (DUF1501 family)
MIYHRRDFLRISLGASTATCFAPVRVADLQAAEDHGRARGGRALVALQLSGGNDGLNTIVPYGDDEYYRRRPTIGLPADQLHRINPHLGFHPRMRAVAGLYEDGRLSIVQGVGYPRVDGDHEVSMRYWQTARPHDGHCQTGWLGRVADRLVQPQPHAVPAVFVGTVRQPLTFNARQTAVPSLRSLDQWTLPEASQRGGADSTRQLAMLARRPHPQNGDSLLGFVQQSTLAACTRSEKVEQIVRDEASRPSGHYPPYQLAQSLRIVARLIRADLGVQVYGTELGGDGFGGFDNHANQLGNHCALLHQLSESVTAFIEDLTRDKLIDQVVLMTYSEFGRTAAENGRRGTDHGSAAPVLLAGGSLKAGLVGPHPGFSELEGGGLKHHTDFRRLYATVLDHWLKLDSQTILAERFEPLGLFQT